MKRIMAVDFGEVRTGLAISDETRTLASGIGYIRSDYIVKTAKEVAAAAVKEDVELIVLGHPINMNGTLGPRSERAKEFKGLLEAECPIPVTLFDERLTTVAAHGYLNETNRRGKKRREVIDTLSAEILLQTYLDLQKNKQGTP